MNAKAPTPPVRILVVDDDVRLRDLLTRYLTGQGFDVRAIPDARELDKRLQRDPPNLVVLDLMLPGEDGLAVCRRLRGAGEDVPIIMLTAKGEDVDRIVGLEMGADDYLPKPFNPRELVARIHAVLRRHALRPAPGTPGESGLVPFGRHHLDLAARTLALDGQVTHLTSGQQLSFSQLDTVLGFIRRLAATTTHAAVGSRPASRAAARPAAVSGSRPASRSSSRSRRTRSESASSSCWASRKARLASVVARST